MEIQAVGSMNPVYTLYYLLLHDLASRTELISKLAKRDIDAVFHYVPLPSSPMGKGVGSKKGVLPNTKYLSE